MTSEQYSNVHKTRHFTRKYVDMCAKCADFDVRQQERISNLLSEQQSVRLAKLEATKQIYAPTALSRTEIPTAKLQRPRSAQPAPRKFAQPVPTAQHRSAQHALPIGTAPGYYICKASQHDKLARTQPLKKRRARRKFKVLSKAKSMTRIPKITLKPPQRLRDHLCINTQLQKGLAEEISRAPSHQTGRLRHRKTSDYMNMILF
jgi:hypothetical protein